MKRLVKKFLHRLGLSSVWHRWRNEAHFTVAMFHRVLDPRDPRFAGANPAYTVTTEEFEYCLRLFKRHYSVVSYNDLMRARAGKLRLPERPLLITFDDGWQDNWQYATPILRQHQLPSLLFVATGHIGNQEGFWQEELAEAIQRGQVDLQSTGSHQYVERMSRLPAAERAKAIASLPNAPALPRRMIDRSELERIGASEMAIGAHGHSHEPLTEVDDPILEFDKCKAALSGLARHPIPLSFPHGRFDGKVVELANREGFSPLFTSVQELTPCASLACCETIGRIEMDLRPFRLANGQFDEAGLVFSMITQPHRK